MAELTGFEPAVSCVTGRHVGPLHHSSMLIYVKQWCRREDLNPQPTDYKSVALPVELQRHITLSTSASVHANAIMVGADGIEPPTLCL
jgi:hypothetical protein